MSNSNKYMSNGWNNKKFYSFKKKGPIDKNKINYLKKLKKQNTRKESHKKINFKINKIYNEIEGNKNDISFFLILTNTNGVNSYKTPNFIII